MEANLISVGGDFTLNKIFRNLISKKAIQIFVLVMITLGSLASARAQLLDNSGDDFILAFLPNFDAGVTIELHLTSDVSTNVTVEYPVNSPTFTTTVPVNPGNITIVPLPIQSATDWTPDVVANNCVRVEAPDEFVCYMINRRTASSDAALALPIDVMNTEYIVMTYNAAFGGGEFTVYAGFDNTTVTITPKNAIVGHPAATPFTVTLNRGEGYHALSQVGGGPNGSLAGSIVSADRPVGLVNGNRCTQIPFGTAACDHIFEIAQPVQTWGTEVLVTNLPNRSGSIYRILASVDNTTITLDGTSLGTINTGDFIETSALSGSHVIAGDNAIYVAQFMPGQNFAGSTLGDPAMGNMIPSEQYLNSYTFSTVGGGQFAQNFVTIIAQNSDVGSMTLDGTVIPAGDFTSITGTDFSTAIVALSSGTHTTASGEGHGITVEGFNSFDSYVYPGGARFQFINPMGDANPPICDISISGDTATGSATDNRPSEDTNGNGVLDPGEDLNGNGQIDEDTGIFFVVLEPGSTNLVLSVDPFTPGDPVVTYTVTLMDPSVPGNGTVTATDGAGNTCSVQIDLAGGVQQMILVGVDEDERSLVAVDVEAATPEVTSLGHVIFDGKRIREMEAMAWDATAQQLLVISNSKGGRLFRIDPADIPSTPGMGDIPAELIGKTGSTHINGIAIHPVTGELFGVDAETEELVKIDKSNAAVTPIGGLGFEDVEGLAFTLDAQPVLFGIDNDDHKLITIHTGTGAGTAVSSNEVGFRNVETLVFSADGTLFGFSDAATDRFIKIDRGTGIGSEFPTIGADGRDIEGLAFMSTSSPLPIPHPVFAKSSHSLQSSVPDDFSLGQNYPNPFNPTTRIQYEIPARIANAVHVQLKVYNLLGELVRELVDELKNPGQYTVEWDGRNNLGEPVSSGVYIYQLVAGEFRQTRRMLLIK